VLAGSAAPGPPPGPTAEQLELAGRGGLQLELRGATLTVVSDDRPGLLAVVAGTLALHRLDIRSAVAFSGGASRAIEVLEVTGPERLEAGRLRADLARALSGELLLEARLGDLDASAARRHRTAAGEPAVRVLVEAATSARAAIVEVRAADAPGLLYRLTRLIAEEGLDVVSARVSTLGHEVVDTFYVCEAGGGRPTVPRLEGLAERLVATSAAQAE